MNTNELMVKTILSKQRNTNGAMLNFWGKGWLKTVMLATCLSIMMLGCSDNNTPDPDVDATVDYKDMKSDATISMDMAKDDGNMEDMTTDGTVSMDMPDDMAKDDGNMEDMKGMEDMGADSGTIIPDVANLLIDDQSLDAPFDTLAIRSASLPKAAMKNGTLRIRFVGGSNDGEEAGTIEIDFSAAANDITLKLDEPITGTQLLVADILDDKDDVYLDINNSPLEVTFTVIGDTTNPTMSVENQMIDPTDLYTLNISNVVVPERFTVGIWLAIYEDDNGALGTIRGKEKFLPGEYTDATFKATSKFIKASRLHVVMRTPRPASGSWDSSGPIVQTLSGIDVKSEFELNGTPFQAALEVEDQVVDPVNIGFSKLKIKSATIPLEYLGGGWVGIFTDNAGAPGAFIGNHKFNKGTKDDTTITLNTNLQGDQTLHAKIFGGQLWANAQSNPLSGQSGDEIIVSFRTGAQSLSYIDAPPYTTNRPRHVVVRRAYSFNGPAWVTLSRDNNGSPGTLIAKKKILGKFAGNVHFNSLTSDFESSGNTVDFLTGKPGTYRRAARGVDKLHVQLYEDNPADGVFTYTPNGTEDLPVLDANSNPVTKIMTVTVEASIKNEQKDSSRYFLPCTLSQHIANATSLPVDCRCHVNVVSLDFPECKASIADFLKMSYGAGPRVKTLNFGSFKSGFAEPAQKELIALAIWKDHQTVWPENSITINVGAVMAINTETRARRIIGGRYKDTAGVIKDYGTGPVLSYPFDIQKGPDGMYYIANYSYVRIGASLTPGVDIIKMDPATGNRSYVWRSNHLGYNFNNEVNPYGHCGHGRSEKFGYYSVQFGRKAFGIDDAGNFYLSYAHNGATPTSNGVGIAKISKDGSSCDVVTSTGVGANNVVYKGNNVGTGPVPQAGPYKGMLVKDGKLYTSTGLTGDLYEVDIATGNRTVLHTYGVHDTNRGSTGSHVMWDPYRNLIWQAGFSNATLMFDPTTGTTEPLWCPQNDRNYKGIACNKLAAWGNNGLLLERGMWLHPSRNDYIFVVNGSMIMRVDLTAGTSEIFSY